jgi:hypothetical protein
MTYSRTFLGQERNGIEEIHDQTLSPWREGSDSGNPVGDGQGRRSLRSIVAGS